MKRVLIALFLLTSVGICDAQNLKFNSDKKFKIVQFTDLHTVPGDRRSDVVFENFDIVIKSENPDLIIVTGDIIYKKPGVKSFEFVMGALDKYNVPFMITFGNHDFEFGASNEELFEVAKGYKNFVGHSVEGINGVGNSDVVVKSSDGQKDAALIYCFDSHKYSKYKERGIGGYDNIKRDQIDWYIKTSNAHIANNSDTLLALSYFHIPLPEYHYALAENRFKMDGICKEKPCAPLLNTGLFSAFKEQGDVRGVFVGHDHDNDFAIPYFGILLAYGRFSGGPTEYFHLKMNGARVVELTEGEKQYKTWLRLRNGEVGQEVVF